MGRIGKVIAWLMVLGVCLFGDFLGLDNVFGGFLRGQDEPQGSPYGIEAKVLDRAVRKWQDCRIGSVDVTKYDKDHNVIGHKFEDPDGNTAHRLTGLSLPLLFRWGRYNLRFLPNAPLEDGTEAAVIQFSPRPDPIEAEENESEDLNKALNKLSGTVYLNLEPEGVGGGNIVRVYGNLKREVSYSRWYTLSKPIFWLQELGFSLKQKRQGESWRPDVVMGGYTWRRLGGDPVPNDFRLTYDCGT